MRSRPCTTELPAVSAASAGFTLLECVIATLLMTLMAYGWMRLHSSHAELVASLDEDLFTHKSYFVDRPESEAARVIGVAARLSRNPAVLPDAPDPSALFALTILSTERQLRPPSASARVHMVEN